MKHSGDNLTGAGSGDDEVRQPKACVHTLRHRDATTITTNVLISQVINVRLDLAPPHAREIVFVVNASSGQFLGTVAPLDGGRPTCPEDGEGPQAGQCADRQKQKPPTDL